MSFRDYLESKAITLCAGGIGIMYLVLVSWLCEVPFSLLLICLFSGIFVFLIFLLFNWHGQTGKTTASMWSSGFTK